VPAGNSRSIGLELEALRAIDRYGITKQGEQYVGFKALPSGSLVGVSAERGARSFVSTAGSTRR
jgi:hypothetical protein